MPGLHVSLAGVWDRAMSDGTRAWLGHSVNADGIATDASLVFDRDATGALSISLGTVWANGQTYEVRRAAPGVVAVAQVADGAFETNDWHVAPQQGDAPSAQPSDTPIDNNPLLGLTPASYDVDYDSVAGADMEAQSGTDAYVDVLVLYTPGAANAVSDIRARIKQYVANANLANNNDGIGYKFNLVRVQQYNFTETSSISSDLATIRTDPTIATLRANYAADLVALVGTGYVAGSNLCGLGYQNNDWGSTGKAYGFSIWDPSTTRCNSTTGAHEMGHNMTLRHDWANDDQNGANSPSYGSYNHGYTSVPGDFNTVMGYSTPACPGGGCTAIPYWSNPNANYNNVPRGTAESLPQPAYDAKALAYVMPYAAKWFSNPNPFGALQYVTAYPNGVRLQGWAVDPDRRTTSLTVQSWVDGVYVNSATANVYRSDIASDLPGYGGYHGFSFTLAASGGTHSFCVRAVNVAYGTVNTQLPSCISFTVPVNPVGAISGYTRVPGGITLTGWALDPNTSLPISVQVQVDGVTQTTIAANLGSPSPSGAWSEWYDRGHGFSANLSLSSGVAHNVCVVGVNYAAGVNTTVDCQSISINGDPVGSFLTLHYWPTGIGVGGWVLDPDTSDYTPIQVTVDGVVRGAAAGGGTWYTDYTLPSQWSAYGPYHSFWVGIDNLSVGTHNVCVTAINYSGTGGVNKSLGCKSIFYSHDPQGSFTATRTAANVVQVTGWAIDPDTSSPIQIKATFVGVQGPPITAGDNWSSSTYNSEFRTSEFGSNHAFTTSGAIGVDPQGGGQRVCVTAINTGSGADTDLGCELV